MIARLWRGWTTRATRTLKRKEFSAAGPIIVVAMR